MREAEGGIGERASYNCQSRRVSGLVPCHQHSSTHPRHAACASRVARVTHHAPTRPAYTACYSCYSGLLYNFVPRLATLSLCLFTCQHQKRGGAARRTRG